MVQHPQSASIHNGRLTIQGMVVCMAFLESDHIMLPSSPLLGWCVRVGGGGTLRVVALPPPALLRCRPGGPGTTSSVIALQFSVLYLGRNHPVACWLPQHTHLKCCGTSTTAIARLLRCSPPGGMPTDGCKFVVKCAALWHAALSKSRLFTLPTHLFIKKVGS
jgi:hypothetical protein